MLLEQISIHALREEGDYSSSSSLGFAAIFLSTPSARRATGSAAGAPPFLLFLSTPSARRATILRIDYSVKVKEISIHALREEGDQILR